MKDRLGYKAFKDLDIDKRKNKRLGSFYYDSSDDLVKDNIVLTDTDNWFEYKQDPNKSIRGFSFNGIVDRPWAEFKNITGPMTAYDLFKDIDIYDGDNTVNLLNFVYKKDLLKKLFQKADITDDELKHIVIPQEQAKRLSGAFNYPKGNLLEDTMALNYYVYNGEDDPLFEEGHLERFTNPINEFTRRPLWLIKVQDILDDKLSKISNKRIKDEPIDSLRDSYAEYQAKKIQPIKSLSMPFETMYNLIKAPSSQELYSKYKKLVDDLVTRYKDFWDLSELPEIKSTDSDDEYFRKINKINNDLTAQHSTLIKSGDEEKIYDYNDFVTDLQNLQANHTHVNLLKSIIDNMENIKSDKNLKHIISAIHRRF